MVSGPQRAKIENLRANSAPRRLSPLVASWTAVDLRSAILPLSFPVRSQLFFGSIPIRSLTADRMRCLHPRYRSVVWIET